MDIDHIFDTQETIEWLTFEIENNREVIKWLKIHGAEVELYQIADLAKKYAKYYKISAFTAEDEAEWRRLHNILLSCPEGYPIGLHIEFMNISRSPDLDGPKYIPPTKQYSENTVIFVKLLQKIHALVDHVIDTARDDYLKIEATQASIDLYNAVAKVEINIPIGEL